MPPFGPFELIQRKRHYRRKKKGRTYKFDDKGKRIRNPKIYDFGPQARKKSIPPRYISQNDQLKAIIKNPIDPQAELGDSSSPYAPFPGWALMWASNIYDDGTSYEGLTCFEVPHGVGVETMGFSSGPDLETLGDKYEGEYYAGFKHGLGQTADFSNTKIYKGEWSSGIKHGCGIEYNLKPFYDEVLKGFNDVEAFNKVWPLIKQKAKIGQWFYGSYKRKAKTSGAKGPRKWFGLIPYREDQHRSWNYCTVQEIKALEKEIEQVVERARRFEWKPYGEVALRFAQLDMNVPAPIMQNPTLYPFETMWMAPGPASQVHAVPEDPYIKLRLQQHAKEHYKIHQQYNFDLVPKPGTDQWFAEVYFDAIFNNVSGSPAMTFQDRVDMELKEPEESWRREKELAKVEYPSLFNRMFRRKQYFPENEQIEYDEYGNVIPKEDEEQSQEKESQQEDDDTYDDGIIFTTI